MAIYIVVYEVTEVDAVDSDLISAIAGLLSMYVCRLIMVEEVITHKINIGISKRLGKVQIWPLDQIIMRIQHPTRKRVRIRVMLCTNTLTLYKSLHLQD